MNFDAVTIERMVREVLSQTQAPASVRNSTASIAKAQETLLSVPTVGTPKPEVSATPIAVVIQDRIVTADLIKEQAKPGEKIVITKQAILTPAAQDYLRNYRIAFERRDTVSAGASQANVRWKVLVGGVADHTLRAIETVCQQRSQVQRELVGSANEAVSAAISSICRAEVGGVIVVTNKPDVVACLANRQHAIRAAVIGDLASWLRLQPQLKPNVVCISPQGRSFMELQNILNKVVTGPAPEVQADWS